MSHVQFRSRLSFRGRFGRKDFWLNWLGAILLLVLSIVQATLLSQTGRVGAGVGGVLSVVGVFMAAWVSLATQVKRWHDLNRSGWMVLLNFVPVLGFFICVVSLGFLKGTAGSNRFDAKTETLTENPAPAGGEPPPLKAPPPERKPTKSGRRLLAVGLGLVAVAVLSGGAFFLVSPRGDWATRRSWVRATLGSPTECQAMAWRYRAGRGLPQDFSQAAKWFERAANKGLAPAQYDLGVLYFYGLGVSADPERARPLLEAAVQQNYVPAMTLLGLCHEVETPGDGVAISLWEQAAAGGDPWAESLLGSAHLAKRDQGDGRENLILGLYWLETARRHGVETVGGLLQHVWATVAAEELEAVTEEVFGRLENGKPDPLPQVVATTAATAEPASDNPPPSDAPAETPAETTVATPLGDEVLTKVRTLPEYVTVSTLYAEKSQADPSWPASVEGQAVGQYLQTMRSDAQATDLKKGDDGKLVLEYSVGGNAVSDEGVRVEDIGSLPEYRKSVIDAVAQNIVAAPRPMAVTEFLKQAGNIGGVGK